MKKYFKLIFLPAVLVALAIAFSACTSPAPEPLVQQPVVPPPAQAYETPPAEEIPPADTVVEPDGIPLFLVTDYGGIDDGSFNQEAWEGLVAYAQANGIAHDFIQPAGVSDEEYIRAIEMAVNSGAQVVVMSGFLFSAAIYEAQDMFPDINFILLDAKPQPEGGEARVGRNVVSIFYAEEQAGFLAGFAAVMEGYRSLGFMGDIPVPPIIRFGNGFIEGANYAAESLELAPGEVTINYTYVMTSSTSPEVVALASSWYATGIEVIFAAAGDAGLSVFYAAQASEASSIGVATDQHGASPTVITSALKELSTSVYDMIAAHFDGTFPGGQILRYDAAVNGIGLPMATSRFENFTQDQYDAIFARLASGEITVTTQVAPTVADINLNSEFVTIIQM